MAKSLAFSTLFSVILLVQGTSAVFRNHHLNQFDANSEPIHSPKNSVESFVTQRVDNFDPNNDATWQQRYLILGEFWQPGGCIFILLTGEWAASPDRFENTMMYEMSRRFDCYMIQLEHRYYGDSRPTPDISNENLKYLTVVQVLADTAHFVRHIRTESVTPGARDSPVIVFGRRYAGSLSVWFRQSYPHLTVGAWSSSSPTQSVVNHFQFKELAGAIYRHVAGNECYERIERGFVAMEQLVADGRSNDLANMFHLCDDIESTLDVQFFFEVISDFYSSFTQFERDTDIGTVCDSLLSNETLTDAEALATIVIDQLNGECLALNYEQTVEEYRQTNWTDSSVAAGDRQWMYQRCTQFGWHHTTDSQFQPFGSSLPVEFYVRSCQDVFGEIYTAELKLENSARFNTVFGGVTPRSSNALYIQGQLDPWRTAGVQTDDNNNSTTTIVIEGASQSNDIGPISETDSDAVAEAKETIMEVISGWIVNGTPRSFNWNNKLEDSASVFDNEIRTKD